MTTVYLEPKSPIAGLTRLEFMYTPQIEYSHDVKYDAYSLVHTNYQPYAYTRSENPSLSISCKFSAHTVDHFKKSEEAIRFLRTYTKMNYGRNDPMRGQPPRILRLFAYGNKMFNDVPVVISKFSMTFPEDCDYVTLNSTSTDYTLDQHDAGAGMTGVEYMPTETGDITTLPMIFTINIGLLVQQNPSKVINEFSLEDFAKGNLSSKGYI